MGKFFKLQIIFHLIEDTCQITLKCYFLISCKYGLQSDVDFQIICGWVGFVYCVMLHFSIPWLRFMTDEEQYRKI
jgi:hypothetical protein